MTRPSISFTLALLATVLVTGVALVHEPQGKGRVPAVFLPAVAAANEVEAQIFRPMNVPTTQVIDRDYFALGPLVEISGTVNGDLYAAGGQVLIDGRVNGDVLVAGGRVMLSGHVAQDVRIAGGQVSFSGTVGRNVTVFGGNVELTPAAVITGSLVAAGGNVHVAAPLLRGAKIAAGSLIISNRVGGNVEAAVGSLRITSKAEIRGGVDYVSQQEASVDPGARIQGQLTRRPPPGTPRPSPEKVFAFFAALALVIMAVSFVSTLILGLLSLRFLPRYHEATVSTLRERPWASLGVGFVAAVVTPVAGAILFATVLGIPLALILTAAYLIALYWGRIFALHRLGEATCRLFQASPRPGWAFVLGLVVYYVLALIPVVGWVLALLVVLSGLGAELIARKDFYVAARTRDII
jgi:cytoskeletal protein CcmA (bactofilin family)